MSGAAGDAGLRLVPREAPRVSCSRGRDRAHELKDAWLAGACEIVVPGLWVYEVGSVPGRKAPAEEGLMLTADAAYVRKAGRAGHVRLLRDWSGPAA